MPWKECSVMDERLRFVSRLLEGEAMSDVCREFGISRKTGYKIYRRYQTHGLEALSDRSRRPVRYVNQLPAQIESLIIGLKREKPHWGARKIRPGFIGCYSIRDAYTALTLDCVAADSSEAIQHLPRAYRELSEDHR